MTTRYLDPMYRTLQEQKCKPLHPGICPSRDRNLPIGLPEQYNGSPHRPTSSRQRSAGHGAGSLVSRVAAGQARGRSQMRNFVLLSEGISPPLGLVASRRWVWGASFTSSVRSSAAPRDSHPSAMRKVVPSIRAEVSIPPQRGSIRPAGRHASAGHGVHRSFLRLAPRPAAVPAAELT